MKQTTAKNTLLPIGMGLILSLGLVGTASAEEHMEGGQGAYWTNNAGEAWMSTSGECWFNPAMEKMEKREDVATSSRPPKRSRSRRWWSAPSV
ncbi:MAG: hypothetical protein U5L11_09315 [Arhodomonas sp.]|nr:hypothetical protein [Arhodomonas sp.]